MTRYHPVAIVVLLSAALVLSCGSPPGGRGDDDDVGSLDDDDSAPGDDDDSASPPTCGAGVTVSGALALDDDTFPIAATSASGLTVEVLHKIDVDQYEAGCVSRVEVTYQDGGCDLSLTFSAPGGEFGLTALNLSADSFCPNFPDAMEGSYGLSDVGDISLEGVPPDLPLETGLEEEYCLEATDFSIRGVGSLLLIDSGLERGVEVDLEFSGDVPSVGSPDAECVADQGDDDDSAVGGDDDDVADDDDVGDDDDDDDSGLPKDTFEVGLCNDLDGLEDIVEIYVAPNGGPELDEVLQGDVVEWYACAYLNLVPATYAFRIVDEAGVQYGISGVYLDSYFEYWFDYLDEL